MPNFNNAVNPEVKELKDTDLLAKLQQCVCDEYEAAARYRQIGDRVKDPLVKKLLNDIADEEIVHVGEFRAAIKKMFPNFIQLEINGEEEGTQIIGAPEVTTGDEEDEGEEETEEIEEENAQGDKKSTKTADGKGKVKIDAQQAGKPKKYRIVGSTLVKRD